MSVPDRYTHLWQNFARSRGDEPTPHFLEAFHFHDNEPAASKLAALVLSGQKGATAALLWTHEVLGKPLPKSGDFSIVTTFAGDPVCIIETRRIDIVPFTNVSEEFAATEGEGDGSLGY